MKKTNLYITLVLTVLLWVLNSIANAFYLYWVLGWYDYMMHFLGGLTVGFIVVWARGLVNFSSLPSLRGLPQDKNSQGLSPTMIFILVMLVGIAWEIFEYMTGQTFATEGYTLDVIHDLLMDALGAWSAILLSRRFG